MDNIYTKTQAESLINQLELLIDSLFETKASFQKKLGRLFTFEQQEQIKLLIQKNNINADDPLRLQKFLLALKKSIHELPVVELYLAFEPQQTTIIKIARWFSSNFRQKILIDTTINKRLIGGVIIDVNGVHRDYSLQKVFEEKNERLSILF